MGQLLFRPFCVAKHAFEIIAKELFIMLVTIAKKIILEKSVKAEQNWIYGSPK